MNVSFETGKEKSFLQISSLRLFMASLCLIFLSVSEKKMNTVSAVNKVCLKDLWKNLSEQLTALALQQ